MIQNLGTVLTVLARSEAAEHFMHADVDAFGAPSECHVLVSRGEAQRQRRARKLAEALARRPMRCIKREAQRRGMPIGSPRWQAFVGRVCDARYPF